MAGELNNDGDSVRFRPEELIAVQLRSRQDFQEGLELKLEIPRALRNYPNSFALMIFRKITPEPEMGRNSYRGTRVFMRLLPASNSLFIRIPLEKKHSITGDAFTEVMPVSIEAGSFPLLITLLPVMKGLPDVAFEQTLEMSMQTLWKNEGTLRVSISNPSGNEDEEISVFIDGETAGVEQAVSLTAGIHHVRVESTHAPAMEKNIAIEPGKEVVLPFELDYRLPEVLVDVPEGAVLILDGQTMNTGSTPALITLEPGTHAIEYELGEVRVSREFTLNPGGKVRINLVLDINIVDIANGAGNNFGAGDG